MNRRNFVQLTSVVSALAASGRLPLLAAPVAKASRNIFTDPPAIEPITGAVQTFTPVAGPFSAKENSKWIYDLLSWEGLQKDGAARNVSSGSLTIQRGGRNTGAYAVKQRVGLSGGRQNVFLNVDLETDETSGGVRKWSVVSDFSEFNSDENPNDSGLVLNGQYDGKTVRLCGPDMDISYSVDGLLLSQWVFPDLLARMLFDGRRTLEFTLLDDGLKIRPEQILSYEGMVQVPLKNGEIPLHVWMQTGRGILPVHWMLDEAGRTQLVTHSSLNWALREIG